MDCLHPGSVNMKRVDFNVRNDWEYVNNYKELQQSFNRMKVDRAFNVNQLSKGKRQDSIEFMQWFKGYWDEYSGGEDLASQYDAVGRRQLCKTGDWKKVGYSRCVARRPFESNCTGIYHDRYGLLQFSTGASSTRPKQASHARIAAVKSKNAVRTATAVNNAATIKAVDNATPAVDPEMEAKLNALGEEVTELKLKIDTAERERDFYFDKLRDIEIMCQSPELADIPVRSGLGYIFCRLGIVFVCIFLSECLGHWITSACFHTNAGCCRFCELWKRCFTL